MLPEEGGQNDGTEKEKEAHPALADEMITPAHVSVSRTAEDAVESVEEFLQSPPGFLFRPEQEGRQGR